MTQENNIQEVPAEADALLLLVGDKGVPLFWSTVGSSQNVHKMYNLLQSYKPGSDLGSALRAFWAAKHPQPWELTNSPEELDLSPLSEALPCGHLTTVYVARNHKLALDALLLIPQLQLSEAEWEALHTVLETHTTSRLKLFLLCS